MSKYEVIRANRNGLKLNIDFTVLGNKIQKAQNVLDEKVWNDVRNYMPVDSGNLISETNAINQNLQGQGRVYLYPPNSDYGHYQYEGIVYVDPKTKKGAFYSPTYGFWSRPGVKKEPSERKLNYSNPNAHDHWGTVAIENHYDEWVKLVKRALE